MERVPPERDVNDGNAVAVVRKMERNTRELNIWMNSTA